eukprot:Sspe_Gene.10534::Locus_3526_Transcript_1_1_Confidence_1.000_Length_3890::g.10534::m.10534
MAGGINALWERMVDTLRREGTELSEVISCTDAVLGKLLQDLGFTALECAKLQTEWVRRCRAASLSPVDSTTHPRDYERVQALLPPRAVRILQVERVENPYLEERFAQTAMSLSRPSHPVRSLWLRVDRYAGNESFAEAIGKVARLGFGRTLSPLFFSERSLPPVAFHPQFKNLTYKLLLCEVAVGSVRVVEPAEGQQAVETADAESLAAAGVDSLFIPPVRAFQSTEGDGFDNEYVIFREHQAIPRFIVTVLCDPDTTPPACARPAPIPAVPLPPLLTPTHVDAHPPTTEPRFHLDPIPASPTAEMISRARQLSSPRFPTTSTAPLPPAPILSPPTAVTPRGATPRDDTPQAVVDTTPPVPQPAVNVTDRSSRRSLISPPPAPRRVPCDAFSGAHPTDHPHPSIASIAAQSLRAPLRHQSPARQNTPTTSLPLLRGAPSPVPSPLIPRTVSQNEAPRPASPHLHRPVPAVVAQDLVSPATPTHPVPVPDPPAATTMRTTMATSQLRDTTAAETQRLLQETSRLISLQGSRVHGTMTRAPQEAKSPSPFSRTASTGHAPRGTLQVPRSVPSAPSPPQPVRAPLDSSVTTSPFHDTHRSTTYSTHRPPSNPPQPDLAPSDSIPPPCSKPTGGNPILQAALRHATANDLSATLLTASARSVPGPAHSHSTLSASPSLPDTAQPPGNPPETPPPQPPPPPAPPTPPAEDDTTQPPPQHESSTPVAAPDNPPTEPPAEGKEEEREGDSDAEDNAESGEVAQPPDDKVECSSDTKDRDVSQLEATLRSQSQRQEAHSRLMEAVQRPVSREQQESISATAREVMMTAFRKGVDHIKEAIEDDDICEANFTQSILPAPTPPGPTPRLNPSAANLPANLADMPLAELHEAIGSPPARHPPRDATPSPPAPSHTPMSSPAPSPASDPHTPSPRDCASPKPSDQSPEPPDHSATPNVAPAVAPEGTVEAVPAKRPSPPPSLPEEPPAEEWEDKVKSALRRISVISTKGAAGLMASQPCPPQSEPSDVTGRARTVLTPPSEPIAAQSITPCDDRPPPSDPRVSPAPCPPPWPSAGSSFSSPSTARPTDPSPHSFRTPPPPPERVQGHVLTTPSAVHPAGPSFDTTVPLPSPEKGVEAGVGTKTPADKCFDARQASKEAVRALLEKLMQSWPSDASPPAEADFERRPSAKEELDAFERTLQRIEQSAKADFDAVNTKLEFLKGRMEATRQNWTGSLMARSDADWVPPDIPGGLFGPAYTAFAGEYRRLLEHDPPL